MLTLLHVTSFLLSELWRTVKTQKMTIKMWNEFDLYYKQILKKRKN